MIERWDLTSNCNLPSMTTCEDGEFVLYEDHVKMVNHLLEALEECRMLENEVETLRMQLVACGGTTEPKPEPEAAAREAAARATAARWAAREAAAYAAEAEARAAQLARLVETAKAKGEKP